MGRNRAPRSPCEPVRVWDPIRVPCAPGKHLPGMEIKEELLMKKRFVALLLCLVMVVGLIPAAMAAGPEADRNYITFKANDGSYGSSSERLQQLTESDVAFGKVTLRANDFTRDGYTFLGWATDPNGQKIYNDGQTVSVTELFGGRTYAVLYAVCQKDGVTPPVGPYTVTYRQLMEVSLTDPDVVDANVGAMYTVKNFPQTWTVPTGKVFAGWTTNGSNLYAPNENIVLSQNTILYPVYRDTVSTCEITYNDARDQQEWKVTVNVGDFVYIDLNGGTEAYLDNVKITASGSYTVTRSCTLTFAYKGAQKSLGWDYDAARTRFTARWAVSNVKVTYYDYDYARVMEETLAYGGTVTVDPNGGAAYLDSTYVNRQTVLNVTKNATLYDATRTGYKFYGWDKTYDRNGQPVFTAMWTKNGQADTYDIFYYDFDDAKSEYARFYANTPIVIDPNGGTARLDTMSFTTKQSFRINRDYTLSDAARTGYKFYGWDLTKSGDTYTFTAMWTKNGLSETYDVYYYDYDDAKSEYARFYIDTPIVIDPAGGSARLNNMPFANKQSFKIDKDYTLSDAARTGYTFYGWDLTKSGNTYTFTAMWTKATSTVPYMLNGEDHYAYIKGYPNGSFKPNATITRAEASSIFYRLLTDSTRRTYSTSYNTFKDVPAKAWYNTAVSTMAKLGIVNGGSDGCFRPNDPITRAEIAAMIARCDGNSYGSAYTNFSDVKGHWAASYIARAYELGWINGYGSTYEPDKYITRAETVAILNRVLNRAPQTTSDLLSGLNTFNDVSVTSWYYLDVEEAANSHTYTRKTNDYEYWDKLISDPSWL